MTFESYVFIKDNDIIVKLYAQIKRVSKTKIIDYRVGMVDKG